MRPLAHSARILQIATSVLALAGAPACVESFSANCGAECPGLVVGLIIPDNATTTSEIPDVTPGTIQVSAAPNLTVAESGTSRGFFISLGSQPTAAVTVSLSSADTGEVTVAPANLSFDATNYQFGQVVTVTGVDDAIIDTNQIVSITVGPTSSTDPAYNGINDTLVNVTNLDDESPNVIVTQTGANLVTGEDGTTDTYTVVLTTNPTGDVDVNLTSATGGLTNGLAATTLTFTSGACGPGPGNWCTARTVTLSAINDAAIEGLSGGFVTHTVSSGDPAYNGYSIPGVFQSILDNDFLTFVTAATHNGDFDNDAALNGDGDGDGIAEADAFCMADANRPDTRTYRALMASPVPAPGRRATLTSDVGDGQINWALRANSDYYRADGTTLIFTTGANSLFIFGSAAASLGGMPGTYWSGLDADWRTAVGSICGKWSSTAGTGRAGDLGATGAAALNSSDPGCASARPIVCVQQLFN